MVANIVSAPSTGLAMLGGTSVCRKYFSRPAWKVQNIGNAVKTASITVSSGTSEISVVNVRLLAVRPSRSSRKRRAQRAQRLEPGPVAQRLHGAGEQRRPAGVVSVLETVMATIMPNMADIPATSPTTPDRVVATTRIVAVGSALALILLELAWEVALARTGRGLLAFKAVPLVFALPGLLRHRMYTYRWVSLLVWLYVAEAAIRIGDRSPSNACAWAELVLAIALFAACATQVRWRHAVASRMLPAEDPRASAGIEH